MPAGPHERFPVYGFIGKEGRPVLALIDGDMFSLKLRSAKVTGDCRAVDLVLVGDQVLALIAAIDAQPDVPVYFDFHQEPFDDGTFTWRQFARGAGLLVGAVALLCGVAWLTL